MRTSVAKLIRAKLVKLVVLVNILKSMTGFDIRYNVPSMLIVNLVNNFERVL